MHKQYRRALAPLILFLTPVLIPVWAGIAPPSLAAQERDVVSSQVTVSSAELSLTLEFGGGEQFTVRMSDGQVLVDGSEIGRYTRGDRLEGSWRALLGELITMDEGAIARRLREWASPTGLDDPAATTAERLESRLRETLRAGATPAAGSDVTILHSGEGIQAAMEALVLRPERLRSLTSALSELRGQSMSLHMGEPLTIPAGETHAGSLLVLEADLVLEGEVEGSVVVIGGSVTLGDDATIGGTLAWADAEVLGNRGAVAGGISEIRPVPDRPESELREELRREIRATIESATAAAATASRSRPSRVSSSLRPIGRGFVRILQTAITFALLLGLGLALLYFTPRHFEVMARTARNATGSSALVGLAGAALALPLWLFGVVALAVTILGIPLLVLWIPLFPLAFAAAATVGYLIVARNLGRWIVDRDMQGFAFEERSRPAAQLGAGLVLLLGAFALAGAAQMGGAWLGIFRGIFLATGVLISILAGTIGLGAVLLSRGGRDARYAGPGWGFRSDAPIDPLDTDADPLDTDPDPLDTDPDPAGPENPFEGGDR